ncbi:hypothetical protein EVAR_4774_1 [Eumeta japonica]|uniref:Uncharacterized protein n=1 Tax=Eumeta variegata TaxID=151549 RepID=A0A4C1T299_EUMVA|nr:hypothetical protein EVAR_4774_1 [Eumeta japonica]
MPKDLYKFCFGRGRPAASAVGAQRRVRAARCSGAGASHLSSPPPPPRAPPRPSRQFNTESNSFCATSSLISPRRQRSDAEESSRRGRYENFY